MFCTSSSYWKVKINQFEIWLADLNPRMGTESGKIRPVVVVQTQLLNSKHPSSIICPVTSMVQPEADILRVHIEKGISGLVQDCDIMVDQIRAVDNVRLKERIGVLPENVQLVLKRNLRLVLDL